MMIIIVLQFGVNIITSSSHPTAHKILSLLSKTKTSFFFHRPTLCPPTWPWAFIILSSSFEDFLKFFVNCISGFTGQSQKFPRLAAAAYFTFLSNKRTSKHHRVLVIHPALSVIQNKKINATRKPPERPMFGCWWKQLQLLTILPLQSIALEKLASAPLPPRFTPLNQVKGSPMHKKKR